MFPKIQSKGLNKTVLINLHKDLLQEVINTRELEISEEVLAKCAEFSRLHSQAILFGLQDLGEIDSSLKTSIYRNFDHSHDGLNEFIKKEATNRNAEAFSDWLVEKFEFARDFFIRATDPEVADEVEQKFIDVLDLLETFLQAEFAKTLLPLLEKIENETRSELLRIYSLEISDEEKKNLALKFLKEKEVESIELFNWGIQKKLNDKIFEQFLAVILILGLTKPTKEILNSELGRAEFGYLSNIKGFFGNSFRQLGEKMFDNLTFQRSLETDQVENTKFNRNDFNLSVLAHARAYFRALVYQSSKSKTDKFKLVVAPSLLPNLNPSGMTNKYLGQIKTFDEWAKINGTENINVVAGLGLHHGSLEYYYPII